MYFSMEDCVQNYRIVTKYFDFFCDSHHQWYEKWEGEEKRRGKAKEGEEEEVNQNLWHKSAVYKL